MTKLACDSATIHLIPSVRRDAEICLILQFHVYICEVNDISFAQKQYNGIHILYDMVYIM